MLCLRQVLSLLLPLRYSLVDIGGSWAQRQVVALTAIQAAIKGKQLNTALALIAELKVTDHHTLRTVGCAAAVDYCTGAGGRCGYYFSLCSTGTEAQKQASCKVV